MIIKKYAREGKGVPSVIEMPGYSRDVKFEIKACGDIYIAESKMQFFKKTIRFEICKKVVSADAQNKEV